MMVALPDPPIWQTALSIWIVQALAEKVLAFLAEAWPIFVVGVVMCAACWVVSRISFAGDKG
jgi:hypothetical protein